MKNLLKVQILLVAALCFVIGSLDAQTYKPDVSKGKTAIWDYGKGGFGGEFTSFKKTNFKANVVSYSESWYGIHQNTSRKGVSPAHGMVWEPGQVVMHPGNHQTQNTKIKFTAPSDGTYEISAKWTNLQACSKKTWAWIYTNAPDAGGKFYNGSPRGYNNIFTKGAQGQNKSVSHKQTFKMTKGQVITFEVGNGLDGWSCDSMGAEIEVKKTAGGSAASSNAASAGVLNGFVGDGLLELWGSMRTKQPGWKYARQDLRALGQDPTSWTIIEKGGGKVVLKNASGYIKVSKRNSNRTYALGYARSEKDALQFIVEKPHAPNQNQGFVSLLSSEHPDYYLKAERTYLALNGKAGGETTWTRTKK